MKTVRDSAFLRRNYEQERIGDSIQKILDYIRRENLNAELIDDGSKTTLLRRQKMRAPGFPGYRRIVVRYEENRGKGFAVRTGLRKAHGEIAVFSDADL